MAQVVISVENARLMRDLVLYAREYPGTVQKAITFRAKKAFERISKLLPPKKKNQGQKNVAKDVAKASTPLNPSNFKNKRIRHLIVKQDQKALQSVADNAKHPNFGGYRVLHFEPGQHSRARDNRGRVRKRAGVASLGYQPWKKYKQGRRKSVGILVSAFARGAALLGARVAGWKRHNHGVGIQRNQLTDPVKPLFSVTSTLPYASDYTRTTDFALAVERRVMVLDLKRRLRALANGKGLLP